MLRSDLPCERRYSPAEGGSFPLNAAKIPCDCKFAPCEERAD